MSGAAVVVGKNMPAAKPILYIRVVCTKLQSEVRLLFIHVMMPYTLFFPATEVGIRWG